MNGQKAIEPAGGAPETAWWTKERKVMISGGLTALSILLALLARRTSCALAALAMAISFVADALLAGFPGCFSTLRHRLTKGGLIFLAAHLVYILALIRASGRDVPTLLRSFAFPFALFFCLTALHGALFYFRFHSSVSRGFFVAAFLYLLTVGVHAAAAIAVYAPSGGWFALNVAGTLLFYLSDAILLGRKYGAIRGAGTTSLIWITYIPAQLCLILGFFLAGTG